MKELVNKLNEARKAYYFGEQSPLSDREYDALYDRLVSMEVETGIILPGSPTQEVGYTVVSELSKVKHEQKALSLDKTKDVHFLETWLGTQDGVLSWKMDGMTVVATYENGQLIMAATRGNGEIGENVTHNARCIKGLPMKIRETGKVIVRGECIESIGSELFGSSPDKKAAFDEKMENYDMQYDKIKIENESTVKKLEKQVIVTDSGIEISIPMDVYNRSDIEIKHNLYGEDEIIIHNVNNMSIK